ncbi:septum site-determining protein Ssd [Pilimelia columellifera]
MPSPPPDATGARRRPLIVTADPDLLDDLLRLAVAAGVEVDLAVDPVAARRWYGDAPLVLIGLDQAEACGRSSLARRARVVVVGASPGPAPWAGAQRAGAEHVALLPEAEPWLVERLAASARRPARGPGHIIAVLSGRGGAGGSVLSVGLALAGARSARSTLLIDADPLGGGLDLILGWEGIDGLRWPELAEARGHIDTPALVRALPGQGDLSLLSWDRGEPLPLPASAMTAALDAGIRGRDLVVVDLPRCLTPAASVALAAADRAIIVAPAELRATAAASRVIRRAAEHCPEIGVIVRLPAPGRLRADEIAEALGVPLAGTLAPEPNLAAALERGRPPGARGPLARLCQSLIADPARPLREAA